MSTIVTRAGKGSALTHNEVDANFVNLNTDKLQSGSTAASLTITSATISGGTITGITDLAIADGGTGASTAQGAINSLAGSVTSGSYLRGNGTNVVMSTIQVADVPTLNQNTTGTASNVTGTVAIANGGTGKTTASTAFNALSPITSTGDLILGNGANSATRLAIGANGYVLTSNGTTASWAAASGGSISWQSVQTSDFTAVAGNGYPVNTTSAVITATLPASPTAGQIITFTDYAGTFGTNRFVLSLNGKKFNGSTTAIKMDVNRESFSIVYVDDTQGWIIYSSNVTTAVQNIVSVDFLVVGGGGGGGASSGGGGGGYRTSSGTSGGGASAESTLTLSLGTTYTVTVGAGGNGSASSTFNAGNVGNDSVLATITSKGGGYGGGGATTNGGTGGSGGGGYYNGTATGGAGTANQGYAGGNAGGGGGGAGGVGSVGTGSDRNGTGGNGGAGVSSSITGSAVSRSGGGGGGGDHRDSGGGGSASAGGGAGGGSGASSGTSGTANTGGGGGGSSSTTGTNIGSGGNGGSGVVIIKIPNNFTATFSGGVTQTMSTAVSGYKIYTVTATSTTSETVTFS